MGEKVHIIFRLKGRPITEKNYYQRDGSQLIDGRHIPVPEVTSEVRAPLTLHARPFAVSVRDRWRKVFDKQYDVFIEAPDGTGPLLEPREVTQAPTQDRVPYHAGDILIVPGADRFWYIRFPGSPFESLKGDTPEDCHRKLLEHPRSQELQRVAERWTPPAVPDMTSDQVLQALEREKYGTRRMRPGDR